MKRLIPWAMVWARVVLCPVIVVGARLGWAGGWLAAIVVFALVDDIADGMLARRWVAIQPRCGWRIRARTRCSISEWWRLCG
ncbi:CDP-alcohol phosphatidyltransferase family protein [Granulicella mallensis]|uniref:Phosphatidylglycerophosphate synthase n=1 Tax=Granulicella mallensis TaxID=940614 RepID=A0A7W7ZRM7_9BACT|nr:CDP-alcohol phosphatidyltransferase family protein [Granulicella mallensis]MBB5064881.1 phosphatidylglycerophosphate synthase [Granulicella mallensis]